MSILKLILIPFAMIYDLVMNIRNRMYDQGIKPSASFDIPVIGVGNLAVGGTGKTPAVEYLIRLLSSSYKLATLSRGYGRKTKGFRFATNQDDAKTIGDEPLQLYSKYGQKVIITVGEDRAFAIPNILQQHEETEIILMDDAFQHRRVKPGLQILLTEYHKPFFEDNVLPYGRLREGPEGAGRADVIIVTKCPDHLEEEHMMNMEHAIKNYSQAPVFFSKIRYGAPTPFGSHGKEFSPNVILVSGIANHVVLEDYVKKEFKLKRHFAHNDHRNYSVGDIRQIESFIGDENGVDLDSISILTTEKDKVKLTSGMFDQYLARLPFFYLPIEMEFFGTGRDFDAFVKAFLSDFSSE